MAVWNWLNGLLDWNAGMAKTAGITLFPDMTTSKIVVTHSVTLLTCSTPCLGILPQNLTSL